MGNTELYWTHHMNRFYFGVFWLTGTNPNHYLLTLQMTHDLVPDPKSQPTNDCLLTANCVRKNEVAATHISS